jgi:Ni,Fe-hydrogenase I small subunit
MTAVMWFRSIVFCFCCSASLLESEASKTPKHAL